MARQKPVARQRLVEFDRGSADIRPVSSARQRSLAATPRPRRETRLATSNRPTNPEILLISAVIQTGDHMPAASAGITGEHFHSHRPEWEWIEQFTFRHRKVPDKATFRSHFPDFPLMRTTDVDYAVEAVEHSHLRYTMASMLKEGTNLLVGDDPVQAMAYVHSSLAGMNRHTGSRDSHYDALREFNPIYEEAKRRVEASQQLGYSGIPWGFPTLNDRTGGLHPGDLAIFAARLGVGKTWFACKVATEALMRGEKVCFVSLEQPRAQIVFRMHTLLAYELGYSLRHRDLMQGTNIDLNDYRSFLVDLPSKVPGELYVSDPTRGRTNPYTLATLMERHDPALMVVDYLTLMQTESDDWQGVAKLSKETKLVASQYGVPILALAQINREGDGGKRPPSAKHLAQSDSIGQDADVIVTAKKDSESVMQLLLAKNRSGQDGQVFYSAFRPNEGRISEITHEEALTLTANDVVDEG